MSKIYFNINEVVDSISQTHKFDKPELIFLNTSDVEAGRIISAVFFPITELKGQAKKSIQNNDILFSEIRPKNKRYAYVNVENPEDYVVSTKLMVLRNKNNLVNNKYFYYFLTSEHMLSILQDRAENRICSFPQITFDLLSEYKIRVPSLLNQNRIVSVLSSLDDKIEINNRINAELEAMAKTLYDYWFVQFDFPDSNGKPYKSSGGKMVYNEELKREIPEGWEVNTVETIGNIVGGSTPSTKKATNFTENGIAWITPKDLSLNKNNKFIDKGEIDVTTEGYTDASLTIMPRGTILMSSRAPVGYLAIARKDITTNQGFKSFVPNQHFSTEYVFYTIKNLLPVIIQNASGSTFKEISSSTLKTIKISIPPTFIIDTYTHKVKNVFQRQESLEIENQRLASLRDWLLPMLMNGQVGFKEEYKEHAQTVSAAPAAIAGYTPSTSKNDNYHKIQSVYAVLWANSLLGVKQGEMATAKDLYLVDRIAGVNTGFTYAQHNWGSFDPAFKKTINNTQYFTKRNFSNSSAYYCDTADNGYLLAKIAEDTKEKVKSSIEEMHNKIFINYFGKQKSEMKELYATVLKCIEDTQNTTLAVIRQAMEDWKTPKQNFPNKAAKFSIEQTKEVLNRIIEEGWDKRVIK